MVRPLKITAISNAVVLLANRQEIPLDITVSFIRNNLVLKQHCYSLKDFVYLYLDLIYNNNTILNVTLTFTDKEAQNEPTLTE